MQTSDQINELASAMAKAQSVIKNPQKDKKNPHFKATYADIASGLDVIRPALSSNGIALFQATDIVQDGVILRTRIVHSSGQWLESTYPVGKFGPHQQMAAALTYAKRQALFALVGVHGEDEDDDGQTAGNADLRQSAPAIAPPTKPAAFSKEESATLRDAMIMELEKCESHADVFTWREDNLAAFNRLTKDDKAIVARAKEIRAGEINQPQSEAAE
jgi:hypothetical protein